MSSARAAVLLLIATIGVVLALLLAGSAHGLALLAYVLFLAALTLTILVERLQIALLPAPELDHLLARPPRREEPIEQLETLTRVLSSASWSQRDVHYRLRPATREIATALLSRRYGVDLDRQPERARALLGDGVAWELARPDRQPPEDGYGRGWSRHELAELLEELEAI